MLSSARRAVALLATAALVALPARADDGEPRPGEPEWGGCFSTGKEEYEIDPKYEIATTGGEDWEVIWSSALVEEPNLGLPWMVCRRNQDKELKAKAQAEWDKRKADGDAWLAERRRIDEVTGMKPGKIAHVETTHFLIAWGVKRIKTADKKSYNEWQAAHLYAARLEEMYSNYKTMFGIEDRNNMRNKHHVYVFEKLREARRAMPVYTGLIGDTTAKRAGGAKKQSVVVTFRDKSTYPSDDDFFRHLTHSMVHQFTAVYYDVSWFEPGQYGLTPPWLNDKYGWLDAGLAHWFERRQAGNTDTYCIREQDTTDRWKGPDWHKNVLKAVRSESWPSFAEVATKPTQALTAKEHQFAWSWIDFLLLTQDQKNMGKAIRLAKEEYRAAEILKEAFGISIISFEQKWAEWVLVDYAEKAKGDTEFWYPGIRFR